MKDSRHLSSAWQTPDWLFKELDAEFHFDIDLCATRENKKCEYFCHNYLDDRWMDNPAEYTDYHTLAGKTCFMNPPYSNPRPFIERAWDDARFCKIVCLVKCDPSTRWWATFWDYDKPIDYYYKGYKHNGPKPGCEVRFFPKRIKFDPPAGYIREHSCDDEHCSTKYPCNERVRQLAKPLSGPTFSSALVIFDRR